MDDREPTGEVIEMTTEEYDEYVRKAQAKANKCPAYNICRYPSHDKYDCIVCGIEDEYSDRLSRGGGSDSDPHAKPRDNR